MSPSERAEAAENILDEIGFISGSAAITSNAVLFVGDMQEKLSESRANLILLLREAAGLAGKYQRITIRSNMKVIPGSFGIAMIAMSAALHAQATPPQNRPHPTPPATQQPIPQPPAASVEPKHSEATATLRAIEAEKATLMSQQQSLVNQVNTLMAGIRDKISQKDADAQSEQKQIREENGWDDSYQYLPPQQLPDGTTSAGKWQHAEKPKK